MFEILLFGEPEIRLDGQPVHLARRKSRALLYYLAAHDQPVRREHLQAFFWPDAGRSSAQQLLRTTLYSLRSIGGDQIEADFDSVHLKETARVDARVLKNQAHLSLDDPQPLREALEGYRGDFLGSFSLPDSVEFETWMITEREYYRGLASRGWVMLSRMYARHDLHSQALSALDHALVFDPLQEDLQRDAIRLAYLAGDRADAIRRYDQLRRLLDEQLGVPPMQATRDVYDEILKDKLPVTQPGRVSRSESAKASHPPAPGADLPFAGRTLELQALQEAAAAGRLAWIEGEPGIGKTRLANEFMHRADGPALQGAAHELEQNVPYQPVAAALRSLLEDGRWAYQRDDILLNSTWRSELVRLTPELFPESQPAEGGTAAGADSRLWEAVHQFLLCLGRSRPVTVFLDDLQWADVSTLALLGYLARQPSPAMILLTASRPVSSRSPAATLIQSLTRIDRLARIPLSRLSAADVHLASGRLTVTPNPMLTHWLAERSEGNPYILAELVRYLRAQGVIDPRGELDAERLSHTPVVPQTVYTLVAARLASISDPARRVLDAAVAAGRVFVLEVTAHAAGLSMEAALDAADEMAAAGLLHPLTESDGAGRHDRYMFEHNLIMEVAYREVGEARHRLMHRRVAEAIEQLYPADLEAQAGVLAFHFGETGDPVRAARYAYLAGKSAMRLSAWREAIRFFEQALKGDNSTGRVRELWAALGEASNLAGESPRASHAYEQALQLAEPGSHEAARLKLDLANTFLLQSRYSEAIALASEVLAEGDAETSRAEFLWGTALSLEGADLPGASDHLKRAEDLCSRADILAIANIDFELGSVAAQRGELEEAVRFYRRSLTLAGEAFTHGDSREEALSRLVLAHNNLAYHLHLLGDADAQRFAEDGLALARENGTVTLLPYLLSTMGEILLAQHKLDEAERYFREGLELAERIHFPERIAGLTANLGRVVLEKGDSSGAIHRFARALAAADALGTRHLAAQIRIWLAPLLPVEDGRQYLREARAIAEDGGRGKLLEEIHRTFESINKQ